MLWRDAPRGATIASRRAPLANKERATNLGEGSTQEEILASPEED